MKPATFLAALACAATLPAMAAGDILRCIARSGAVTYQQMPCPESGLEEHAGIATQYPEVNHAERERLFQREAAMYQRLEAERERLAKQAAQRDAREERRLEREAMVAAAQAAAEQRWVVVARPWRQRNARLQPMVR